ncbi:hypothetical protein Tco_0862793 [Tanacetum coccineum]
MSMTIQSDVKDKILATPSETSMVDNAPAEMLHDLEQQMEKRADDGCTLWIKLYSKYEYEIRYHPGRANVVIDALRRKEQVKPRRVQVMAMTIQYGPKAAGDRQKSYADNRRKPLEFEVGDRVMLKVSPWKGVIRFRKKELSGVHDTFHVSNLKKCLVDASLHVPLDEIKVDKTLRFVEEPIENSDREVKMLKCSRMVVVKFLFDELRDQVVNDVVTQLKENYLKDKYPRLIVWLVKPLVLTCESVAIYGVCDYMCLYAFMWIMWEIGSQSIECDHLNEIGMVIEVMVALDISLCSHFSDNENDEHQNDMKVIYNDDGNPSRANIKQALGRFNTTAGNPVKEILLKLNLPDHRSILTDSKGNIKMDMEEYFKKRSPEVSTNSAAPTTLNNEDTPSSSSIIVEHNEAPPLVSSSKEQISLISIDVGDEYIQEDYANLNRNTLITSFNPPVFEEAESSSTTQDPSNMHEFNQVYPSTHTWTKVHPLEQVIGDPSKPVMTRSRLNTDVKVCMYALTVSTTEPKNIKEAMLYHSWIELVQDELH